MDKPLHSRRVFLQHGMAMLSATATIPLFLDSTAHAISAPAGTRHARSGVDGKILVIVQLSGGNDGLNTVVPFADDAYHRARPAIGKRSGDVLKLDDYIGLHPNLAPMKALFDNDQMTLIQGVGYPNPNRSHFRSMDIWHTANPDDERTTSGWLGRYFDATCNGADPKTLEAARGVSLGDTQPLAMKGEKFTPLNFDKPEAFRYRGRDLEGFLSLNEPDQAAPIVDAANRAMRRRATVVENPSADDQINFLSRTALDAQASSDRIQRATQGHKPGVDYPRGGFGEDLRTVAAMIAAEMPTRVYYVSLGGFDTHANQNGRHDQLMATFAQGMAAFWADMKHQKNHERVLLMSFSEFGRRVAQNASQGTDHGAAAPMFLIGSRLRRNVIGRHPSLTDLDAGDLKHNIDFRAVYASVLQNWLEVPSKPILGRQFLGVDVVRG
ncbi:MAG TPA: DUF1501 domain-containing protein [Tepidisphaeraceae bacterium]|nr:DUF1501 domain-containing protein [Tepidisphaeraceae bacterium]